MLKIVELFGGIGSFRKALLNLNILHKVIDYIEIDSNCVKSYNALYSENFKPSCVRNYNLPGDIKIDILIHGSPCQDFSRIGCKKGGKEGSNTRSSLLFETVRIINDSIYKPKWVIWENVKGVLDRNMKNTFFSYINSLNEIGYETKYKVLNAMDFGIPQKRERVFAISYFGKNQFDFDKLEKSEIQNINEFLEDTEDERYLVKQPSMLKFLRNDYKSSFKGRLEIIDKYVYTISTKQMRVPNAGIIKIDSERYRYLTEGECLSLMGFDKKDVEILKNTHKYRKNCTSSILYKQAGTSIVVNILESILKEILKKR